MDRAALERFCVHGLSVEIDAGVESLRPALARLMGEFSVAEFPPGFSSVHGSVRTFESAQVMRHLSPTAVRLCRPDQLIELYQEGERFWMVDDRWGMSELNLLRGTWRSWVLPTPTIDPLRCAEMAVLWPLAQLLRPRGLHLLPAAAVTRGDWAGLFLCPFGLGPELTELVRAGYRVLGQRWTAVREEDGRLALLHMPGLIERTPGPQLRTAGGHVPAHWADLEGQFCGASQNHAFCDSVIVIDSARRQHSEVKRLPVASAMNTLRKTWPIVELNAGRRWRLAAQFAQRCACYEVRLSQSPRDILEMLDTARNATSGTEREKRVAA